MTLIGRNKWKKCEYTNYLNKLEEKIFGGVARGSRRDGYRRLELDDCPMQTLKVDSQK